MTDVLRNHSPKICTQESLTLPPEAGAKFAQALPHETPEWHAMYATLRNSVEGMNGFIKDGAREAVDDPERRRVRGVAAQSAFVAFLLFAANIRKIDEFLKKQEAEAHKVRELPSRRRTKSLSTWAPEASKKPAGIVALTGRAEITVSLGGTLSDPDPPRTA